MFNISPVKRYFITKKLFNIYCNIFLIMKLYIILLVCLISSTMSLVPACRAENYCKGCSTTTPTACTSCFNWKLGHVGAKYLTGTTCLNSATVIIRCMRYDSGLRSASTLLPGACQQCDPLYTLVEKSVTIKGHVTVTPTCVPNRPTGCAAIRECMQLKCSSSDAGYTYTSTCSLCNKGKGASATNFCVGTIIPNCNYSMWVSQQKCLYAHRGYAVAFGNLSAVAYTIDINCQSLATGSTTQCQECWDGYYWNWIHCRLSAKLLGTAFLAIVGLFVN